MLYWIYSAYFAHIDKFSLFKYITFRALLAFIISLLIVIFVGKPFIKFLRRGNVGEGIREDGPATHFSKKGTPTMGGVLIIGSVVITNILTGNFFNKFEIMLLIITVLFGLIGFLDDYLKLAKKNKDGLAGKKKLLGQFSIAALVMIFVYLMPTVQGKVNFSLVDPFMKNHYFYLGAVVYFIVALFIIVGTSNAVNLTDGLDGLCIGPVIFVVSTLAIISYLTGNVNLSSYLYLNYIPQSGEILVFLCSVLGASLGFLWYNFFPAQIFMGDVGSLSLGGMIGCVSIFLKQELLLPIIGFIFLLEAISVILQVWSFKTTGKRIFKMAPIHHHFEKLGLPETKVTMRFWIVTVLLCALALIILKIR